jgi:hypothetical protein
MLKPTKSTIAKNKSKRLKGIEPVISGILIIGVLAVITGVSYQWGMPLMQKNVGTTELHSAEDFARLLDKKIDDIAKNGGSDEITFTSPGQIVVSPLEDRIDFTIETSGSIYSQGGFVCFSRNCDLQNGVWGEDGYSVIGAQVSASDQNYALTKYSVIFRNLTAENLVYSRDIVTPRNATLAGSKNARLIITKIGEERGNTTKTIIKIDLL